MVRPTHSATSAGSTCQWERRGRRWRSTTKHCQSTGQWVTAGETRKALDMFNEALPISRTIGDRRGEAIRLNNIGEAYRLLGETRKALEKHNEALPITREVGDRRGEAGTLNNIGVA